MRSYRSFSVAASAIVVCALVGGVFGRSALSAQDQVPDQYRVFTAALSAIEANYVGEPESDRLVYGAISGMLQTLDPHSSFMDPRSYAQMRERQEGRYYGLGITIQVIDGDITVAAIFEGSPAYQRGLRRGDVIARISGEDTEGWTSDQAVRQLRGPKGTPVSIGIRPIAGLVHHGGGPRYTSLLDPLFPLGLAAHARAAAERYPWIEDWTPVNEPITTARFATLYGHWHPHKHSETPFWSGVRKPVADVVAALP